MRARIQILEEHPHGSILLEWIFMLVWRRATRNHAETSHAGPVVVGIVDIIPRPKFLSPPSHFHNPNNLVSLRGVYVLSGDAEGRRYC